MSLAVCDGFEGYTDQYGLGQKWETYPDPAFGDYLISTTNVRRIGSKYYWFKGRQGPNGYVFRHMIHEHFKTYDESTDRSTIIVGAAIYLNSIGDPPQLGESFGSFYIKAYNTTIFGVTSGGAIQGFHDYTTAEGLFTFGQWNYVEAKLSMYVDGITSVADGEARLNGGTVFVTTTHPFSPSSSYRWVEIYPQHFYDNDLLTYISGGIDDIYIVIGDDGISPEDFLGDIYIDTLKPISNGISNGMTPVGVASNYDCVNDPNIDSDTTYVSTSSTGVSEYYNFSLLPYIADSTVLGVAQNIYYKKTDVAYRGFIPHVYYSGNYYEETEQPLLHVSSTWPYYNMVTFWDQNPVTNSTWIYTEVSNVQFGGEVI